jgi:CBS domain-containing protein
VDWAVWAVIGAILILVGGAFLGGKTRARQILAGRSIGPALSSTRVDEVMSSPPMVVREGVTVGEAARMMLDEGIRSLPVVGADGRMVGIVTESDLTGARPWLSLHGWAQRDAADGVRPPSSLEHAGATPVSEVMSSPVASARPSDALADVIDQMMARKVHHIPVVEDDVPVGIVARHDVLKRLAQRG